MTESWFPRFLGQPPGMSRISRSFSRLDSRSTPWLYSFFPLNLDGRCTCKNRTWLRKNRETSYYYAVTSNLFLLVEATESRGRVELLEGKLSATDEPAPNIDQRSDLLYDRRCSTFTVPLRGSLHPSFFPGQPNKRHYLSETRELTRQTEFSLLRGWLFVFSSTMTFERQDTGSGWLVFLDRGSTQGFSHGFITYCKYCTVRDREPRVLFPL